MKVPAHVVVGDRSRASIRTVHETGGPAVRLSVVPTTGHLVNLKSLTFCRLTEDFFGDRKVAPAGQGIPFS
jgi:hypothetical protein